MSEPHEHLSDSDMAIDVVVVIICLICAGLASGLTQVAESKSFLFISF